MNGLIDVCCRDGKEKKEEQKELLNAEKNINYIFFRECVLLSLLLSFSSEHENECESWKKEEI